jgi:hypothetical protein
LRDVVVDRDAPELLRTSKARARGEPAEKSPWRDREQQAGCDFGLCARRAPKSSMFERVLDGVRGATGNGETWDRQSATAARSRRNEAGQC